MKRLHRLLYGLIVALLPSMASCGILDIDFDAETNLVESITFQYDTVYVMEKDTFFLAPYFYPDTVVSKNVTWVAEDDSIVRCIGSDTIVAAGVGTTNVIVSTVANGKSDTCQVNVMPRWEVLYSDYLYDEVVYVDVDLGEGKTFSPNSMILGAFSDDECLGTAEQLTTSSGKKYLRIRCWVSMLDSEESIVYFMLYDKRTLQLYYFEQTVPLDGETYGTLTNPLKLTLEKY